MKNTFRFLFVVFCLFTITNPLRAQWVQTNGPYGGYTGMRALAVSATNLFAGTNGGVFLSTNNGTSWTGASTGLPEFIGIRALAVSGTNLFAGTNGGVFLSTNNGTSWSAVNTGLTNRGVGALAAVGTNLFAGTVGGVFLSTNNGTSWTAASTGLTSTIVNALAVSGTNLFAGTWGGSGVFLSTSSGTSWGASNTGLMDTCVYALAVSGTNVFAGTDGGVFLSTNNGTSWTGASTGLPEFIGIRALAVSGTNLFAGTNGGVFLSTNNGTSWSAVNTGLTNRGVGALAAVGTNLFAGTDGGVFLSTDRGDSWTPVNTGLTNTSVNVFAVSGANLFAGTDGGVWRRPLSEMITLVLSAPALTSPSNGATGVSTSPTLSWNASTGATSYTLQVSASADFSTLVVNQSGIVGTWYGVSLLNNTTYYWRVNATNAGGTSGWSAAWNFSTIVEAPPAPTLVWPIHTANSVSTTPTLMWNPSSRAVSYRVQVDTMPFFSPAKFDTSGVIGTSLTLPRLWSRMAYFWRVNATNAGGTSSWSDIWYFTTMVVSSVQQIGGAIPNDYSLSQNYPNPFNPTTIIEFGLPQSGYVTLKVYNLLGDEVSTLFSGELAAGGYGVDWNASSVASGIYYYRLQAGNYIETKRLLLLR